jgi:hypothetical protein
LILVIIILLYILNYNKEISSIHGNLSLLQKKTISSKTKNLRKNNFHGNEFDKKYVVYECTNENICGGWGDRLKGIMSAYAISLLTDRYFLIYHVRPCLLTHFFEPSIYFLNTTINYDQANKLWFLDNKDYRKSLSFIDAFNLTTKYITIKNNLEWIEPISKNKIYKEKIKELGYNENNFRIQFLFKDWYSKMFKLNQRLNEKYLKFLTKAKPTDNTKLICAQVRVGDAGGTRFMERGNLKIYWNYMRTNFFKNLTDYRIFLTTDDIEAEAIKEFGNEFVVTNGGPNNHLDFYGKLESNDEKLDKTFLDFHSLIYNTFGKLGVFNRNNPNENLAMFSNMRPSSEFKEQKIIVKNSAYDLYILLVDRAQEFFLGSLTLLYFHFVARSLAPSQIFLLKTPPRIFFLCLSVCHMLYIVYFA